MKGLERIIHDDSNGLDYILVGEVYLPLLAVPNETREIGFYGSLHRNYLKDYKSGLYSYLSLSLSGKLWSYLADENEQCVERRDFLMDQMMEQGLLKEVEALKAMGYDRSYVSMQGLGYKELLSYLDGECTLDDAVSQIKQSTRHFAKRQLTWFRRERDVTWLDIDGAKNEDVISILTEQCVKNLHAAVKIQQK